MGRTGLLIWSVILCISVEKIEASTENGFSFLKVGAISNESQCRRECKLAKLSGELPCNWSVLVHNQCVFLHCYNLKLCRKAGSSQILQRLFDKKPHMERRKRNDRKSVAYRNTAYKLKRSLARRFVKQSRAVKRQSVSDETVDTHNTTSTSTEGSLTATATGLTTTAKPSTTTSILITTAIKPSTSTSILTTATKPSTSTSILTTTTKPSATTTTKASTTKSAETTTTLSTSTSAITATTSEPATPTTILNPTFNTKRHVDIVTNTTAVSKTQVATEMAEQLHPLSTIKQIGTVSTMSKTFPTNVISLTTKTLSFEQETSKQTINFTLTTKSTTTKATTLQPTLEIDLLTTTMSEVAPTTSFQATTMITTAITTLSTTAVPTSLSATVPTPSTEVPTAALTTAVPTTASTTTVPTTSLTTIMSTNVVPDILSLMTSATQSPDKITMPTPKQTAFPSTVSNIGSTVGLSAEVTSQNKDDGGVYDVSEEVTKQVQNTSFLLAVLLLGNLLFVAIIVVFSLQAYESYKKKDYTQVDYLINGMYADSEI
ncbi:uncharacterized protein C11orf24 [Xenopus laevis]|uniref:Uncharacterized protein C11orf24 n=2 Tax=Xenopus laevis TaxID=8355 RepID=A0A1L8GJY1_XENLA|nr:uncharacterized protein C11orf24 [Xenopus laevis]XP_018113163.1 uncharacterized protein C11orf24 [Xenopus laevis]XP_018113164.1 uncharacterized protein C11orf24 [Xenopus laevis]XP_018113165.1 uncharacterized protein C11orf24 [Xenopus laevis]XP_018113166.1 uncharacterized protein C11orf24 [Xenopus laevis]OCT84130.1 hypothetical protein XELAEV_18022270mg [Xenopus laevis]